MHAWHTTYHKIDAYFALRGDMLRLGTAWFTHTLTGNFTETAIGASLWLLQSQWNNYEEYGQITPTNPPKNDNVTMPKHSKMKSA